MNVTPCILDLMPELPPGAVVVRTITRGRVGDVDLESNGLKAVLWESRNPL